MKGEFAYGPELNYLLTPHIGASRAATFAAKNVLYTRINRIMIMFSLIKLKFLIIVNVFVLPWLHFMNFQEFPVDAMPAVEAVDEECGYFTIHPCILNPAISSR